MLIAIDIGNTTIFTAGLEGDEVLFQFRMNTDKDKSGPEYAVQLKNLLAIYDKFEKPAEGVILSSVVPEITGALEQAAQKIFEVPVAVVKRDIKAPFPINLDFPASLGSDRIADVTAVLQEYPLPAIVFDLGTATTCSVIDENGVFQGGLISPGVRTASDALLKKASQLSSYELGEPTRLVGKSTEECINSGIVFGHASMIDGLVSRIRRDTGKRYTVILTGGLSGLIGKFCECSPQIDDKLILKGLRALYELWRAS